MSSLTYDDIRIEEDHGIYIITIDRPSALNALNLKVFMQLEQALDAFKEYDELKGVIITGGGQKSFVAGADISEFSSIPPGGAKAFLSTGNRVMNKIEGYHKLVIAAVNGYALGGGCELAMACHMRIAGEGAKFGMPEVNLGILPGYGGTQRLPQLIGEGRALEMILTGEIIGADQAKSLGLVNHVVPAGGELAKAKEIILSIADKAPLAVEKIIASVNYYDADLHQGIGFEGDQFTALADSHDFKEGTLAFLEKRKAHFTGK